MLRISNLTKRFGKTTVLDDISLSVDSGEFLALLGPSGSGKTTLLRTIAGFEDVDAGEIRIDQRIVVRDRISVAPERRRIGMVFQDYALFPHLSVRDNIAFGLPRGADKIRQVERALQAVDLIDFIDSMPHVLSGGQQQRVALARALAPQPGIVLLDEPFSNLDQALRATVRNDVRRILRDAGVTAVLVTHDQEEALSVADRVAVLFEGTIQHIGTPREVYLEPASTKVARYVGDAQFLTGAVKDATINTDLGILPISNVFPDGEGMALIRPEMVSLDQASSIHGRVTSTQFLGSSQLLEVHLPSENTIRAKIPSIENVRVGDQVGLVVNRPVFVMPIEHTEEGA